jgi:hypothetical protein
MKFPGKVWEKFVKERFFVGSLGLATMNKFNDWPNPENPVTNLIIDSLILDKFYL